ncbi:hypothetical protein [Clostridioides difficile]
MFKKIVAIASSIIVSTICLTGCDFNSNDKKMNLLRLKIWIK